MVWIKSLVAVSIVMGAIGFILWLCLAGPQKLQEVKKQKDTFIEQVKELPDQLKERNNKEK